MRGRVLVCCLVVLLVAGATFLVLDVWFGDEPVGVFDEAAPVGSGGIGFEILDSEGVVDDGG